jgi:hypothetical protein
VLRRASELARVLPSRRQSGAGLALSLPVIPVGVLRRKLMTPLAVGLPGIDRVERLSARRIHAPRYSLPVRRILTCPVQASGPARAVRTAVVADVIDSLARLKRAHKLAEAVSVSAFCAAALSFIKLPIAVRTNRTLPRPAFVKTSLVNVGEVPVKTCHVEAAQGATSNAGSPQLGVMGTTHSLSPSRSLTLTAIRHVTILVQ